MKDNLEFHYVVSYREGVGWWYVPDVEQAVMPNGTIYDWEDGEWIIPSAVTTGKEIENLDFQHYKVLQSMLQQMNGEKNA